MSLKINNIISNALNNEVYDSKMSSCISEENYDYINPIQPKLEEDMIIIKRCRTFISIVFPFINSVSYNYTYTVTDADNGEVLYSSMDSKMKLTVTYGMFSIFIQDAEEIYST